MVPIVHEVLPFLIGCLAVFGLAASCCYLIGRKQAGRGFVALAILSSCYLLFFFRDPHRNPPNEPDAILAGADGIVMAVKEMPENEFLHGDSLRVSIFLSLLDVHVNRSPIAGEVRHLSYHPGKKYFTFMEKSSEYNQHSVIFIEGKGASCLVKQIVGPVARRVVYWLEPNQRLAAGERIGMMKFGSRLDMYFLKSEVELAVREGDRVKAGETVIGRLRERAELNNPSAFP